MGNMRDLKNYINNQRAFSIDKGIIQKGMSYNFNIYGRDTKEQSVVLIFEANNTLTENMYKNLLTTRFLYIYDKDKTLYTDFHTLHCQEVKRSIDLTNILEEIDKVAFNILEDPGSLENLENAKQTVKNTVELIIKDESILDTALSSFSHNYYTHTHSVHVKVYAICLGKRMGLDKKTLENLGLSALLHDVGKSKIPKKVVNKKTKLSEYEYHLVQKHTVYGHEIALKMGITNRDILSGIKNHHEKLDGSGYPEGLRKEKISLFARIICICDIFDALSSRRPYQESLTAFETLLKMKKEMTTQVDVEILNTFILMLNSSSKN